MHSTIDCRGADLLCKKEHVRLRRFGDQRGARGVKAKCWKESRLAILFGFDQLYEIATCDTTVNTWHDQRSIALTKLKLASVADILERELEPMTKEWLRRVNLIPELTDIPLSDLDRTAHLAKLGVEGVSGRNIRHATSPSERTRS